LAVLTLARPAGPAAAEAAGSQPPEVVRIWPGAAPGTEDWTGEEKDTIPEGSSLPVLVTNVTMPTLTVFRPDPAKATGAAMIVAPGGAFQALAFNSEGVLVAKWLADHGVTAFILKYRVRMGSGGGPRPNPGAGAPNTPASREEFEKREHIHDTAAKIAMDDGLQAIRYLRANAAKYHIDPNKIGFMGFSAGGMTTMRVVLNGKPEERPNFAAPIYGAMQTDLPPPKDGPPLFVAAAQDDPQVPVRKSVEIFQAWKSAGLPVELHIYESGGHGFGMLKKNKATDAWPNAFEAWLRGHGWIAAPAP
jgi:acetyl esterase/lipase